MVISDLTYLETVSEVSSIVGGGSKGKKPSKKYGSKTVAVAANVNVTEQNATAVAIGKNDKAVAANFNATYQSALALALK